MIEKKLTKYDRSRLNDFAMKLQEQRKLYLNICEQMFEHDFHKVDSKKDYLGYEKWVRERVNLERRMRSIIRSYEKAYARYSGLCSAIEKEMNEGKY